MPVDPNVIIGLVYFAGSIFTFVALDAFKTLLVSLLGKNLSTDEARKLFIKHTGIDPKTNLNQEYVFECDNCKNMIKYTIPDVVKMSNPILERGITVEAVFGVKSYLLRPQHICEDGRREFTIVHDSKLAVRSKEKSRILYKLQ